MKIFSWLIVVVFGITLGLLLSLREPILNILVGVEILFIGGLIVIQNE